jgi:Mg2+/Co2+ transporter CorB
MEHLESFPDANVGLEIAGYHLEIMEIGDNVILKAKAVRI